MVTLACPTRVCPIPMVSVTAVASEHAAVTVALG
jgi:hypothetical protein